MEIETETTRTTEMSDVERIKDCGFPSEIAEIVLHAYKCGMMVYLQRWSEAKKGFDEYEGKYRRLAVKMADLVIGSDAGDKER